MKFVECTKSGWKTNKVGHYGKGRLHYEVLFFAKCKCIKNK